MSVGLYMDVHVPAAVTRALLLRNLDVLTAQVDGTTELLDRARILNRVLVSQDQDLLAEASRRQRMGLAFNGIFYAHQLGVTLGHLINDLEILARCGGPEDFMNRVEFLPL